MGKTIDLEPQLRTIGKTIDLEPLLRKRGLPADGKQTVIHRSNRSDGQPAEIIPLEPALMQRIDELCRQLREQSRIVGGIGPTLQALSEEFQSQGLFNPAHIEEIGMTMTRRGPGPGYWKRDLSCSDWQPLSPNPGPRPRWA